MMKLSLGAIVAILAPAIVMGAPIEASAPDNNTVIQRSPLDCVLGAQWTANWGDGGWRRYRVEADAQQGRFQYTQQQMLQVWCSYFYCQHIAFPLFVFEICLVPYLTAVFQLMRKRGDRPLMSIRNAGSQMETLMLLRIFRYSLERVATITMSVCTRPQ
jgi:hypothetical protein